MSSSTSRPISPHQFATAIQALPLPNLHLKAAELRNSIAHLRSSNRQLQAFAEAEAEARAEGEGEREGRGGGGEYAEAMAENAQVVRSMEVRIDLLRREVERRGFLWGDGDGDGGNGNGIVNGNGSVPGEVGAGTDIGAGRRSPDGDAPTGDAPTREGEGGPQRRAQAGGNIGDEELARRLRERLDGDEGEGNGEGLHL